jgi:catechol 2,3-dioxygenase-like lactoylglutathione lyase family enzyme
MSETLTQEKPEVADKPRTSVLDLKFISHGTLESKNHDETRKFYEEFMGFEVVRASNMSMFARLGGKHIYVVVPKEEGGPPMSVRNHNGVDVHTEAEVDAAYELVKRDAEKWGLYRISKPMVQHGTYSFYFWDRDDNSWEILCNPPGGYDWMFELGDQKSKGSMDKKFERPPLARGK